MIIKKSKNLFLLKYFYLFFFYFNYCKQCHVFKIAKFEFTVIVHFGQWKTVPSCVFLHYFYILFVTVLKFEKLLHI